MQHSNPKPNEKKESDSVKNEFVIAEHKLDKGNQSAIVLNPISITGEFIAVRSHNSSGSGISIFHCGETLSEVARIPSKQIDVRNVCPIPDSQGQFAVLANSNDTYIWNTSPKCEMHSLIQMPKQHLEESQTIFYGTGFNVTVSGNYARSSFIRNNMNWLYQSDSEDICVQHPIQSWHTDCEYLIRSRQLVIKGRLPRYHFYQLGQSDINQAPTSKTETIDPSYRHYLTPNGELLRTKTSIQSFGFIGNEFLYSSWGQLMGVHIPTLQKRTVYKYVGTILTAFPYGSNIGVQLSSWGTPSNDLIICSAQIDLPAFDDFLAPLIAVAGVRKMIADYAFFSPPGYADKLDKMIEIFQGKLNKLQLQLKAKNEPAQLGSSPNTLFSVSQLASADEKAMDMKLAEKNMSDCLAGLTFLKMNLDTAAYPSNQACVEQMLKLHEIWVTCGVNPDNIDKSSPINAALEKWGCRDEICLAIALIKEITSDVVFELIKPTFSSPSPVSCG